MRRILISLLLLLVIIMTVLCIKNGISIGPLQVYGVGQIKELNYGLNQKINEANSANDSYAGSLTKLKQDISVLIKAKEECLNLINVSTDSQLKDATQTKNYTIEYLWSKIGNHATKEGVVIKFDVISGTIADSNYRTLNFTVTGDYLAITNFISSLENDSTLEFTIDEFSMTQRQAKFTVKDVKVQQERTTTSGRQTSTSGGTTQNTNTAGSTTSTNTEPNNTNTAG